MIGVVVQPAEQAAARELFELCKTPWEFFRDRGQYQVMICTTEPPRHEPARLTLVYGAERTGFDDEHNIPVNSRPGGVTITHAGRRIPLYGRAATFPTGTTELVRHEDTREPVLFAHRAGELTVVRVGYNLLAEIRFLLSEGQPIGNAGRPTLELHLALLRDLITRSGVPLVEIPPVPEGHPFIACLTHDIDHPLLRNHLGDHTMFGFFYRATVGSMLKAGQGKLPLGNLWKNWMAAVRLPLIYLGMAKDIWRQFDRYLEIEAGLGSTYFVIPRRDYPGRNPDGTITRMRVCRYDVTEIVPELKRVMAAGNEVGLHGLDAWLDAAAGREERARVSQAVGAVATGVRMHWLYFDQNSPALLDQEGFTYDSSVGYNETVGYRAGTAQVYRPPGAARLLELPLLIMDTAMFSPGFLNLGEGEAYRRVLGLLDDVAEFGGALTINWHDRSIAPERLWGNFYLKVLGELKKRGAWLPTATRAVAWFAMRRQATLVCEPRETGVLGVRGRWENPDSLPGLRVRVHHPCQRSATEPLATGAAANFLDVRLDNATELRIKV